MNFTIREIAVKTGLSIYTLRYYEKEGIIVGINRDRNGRRVYGNDDIERIQFIKCLKITGLPISDIKKFMKLLSRGDKTITDRKKILMSHKKRIENKIQEYKIFLDKINFKIDHYNGIENSFPAKSLKSLNID